MSHLHLTEAACCLIGLVPAGPVEPYVYGLELVKRSGSGRSFRVVDRWRLAYVLEAVAELAPTLGTPSIGAALVRRIGYLTALG